MINRILIAGKNSAIPHLRDAFSFGHTDLTNFRAELVA